MKTLLIGSRALALNKPEYSKLIHDKTDWDIVSEDKFHVWAETHSPHELNTYRLERYATLPPIKHNDVWLYPINLKGLAIVKRSHLWRDLRFKKHITMYHKHIMDGSFTFDDIDLEILNERTKLTMEAYPQSNPSLKKTKDQFFDDFVVKKFDHDYLHEVVAVSSDSIPMYKKMQNLSVDSVWCLKEKWDEFTHQEKLRCIYEETSVIALERFLIPKDFVFGKKIAYILSLDKVCTTLTSGWFRDYAIDHYDEIVKMFDYVAFNRYENHLMNGSNHVYFK